MSETEIRRLRDIVYGHQSSDLNWAGCREHWLEPEETAWLIEMAKVPLR